MVYDGLQLVVILMDLDSSMTQVKLLDFSSSGDFVPGVLNYLAILRATIL